MTPIGKMNPATSKEHTDARDVARDREAQAAASGANKENSALGRRPTDENKKLGSDAEFARSETEEGEVDEEDYGFGSRFQDVATNALSKAQEFGGTALRESGTFIRRYPAQTVLAGFGLGVVLGMTLLNRR